jgi:hypothetical protein
MDIQIFRCGKEGELLGHVSPKKKERKGQNEDRVAWAACHVVGIRHGIIAEHRRFGARRLL